jgi:hypothetical protein
MSLSSLRTRARAVFGFRSLAIGILLCPAAAFAEPPSKPVGVNIDQARLIKLPERVATIVVGNPLIADVTLQPGGVVVVTGKSYGVTNLIAMERGGEVLVERLIQVEAPADPIITVYNGIERQSLSCQPICQPRITLGDSDRFFRPTITQAGTLSGQAYGAASGKAGN